MRASALCILLSVGGRSLIFKCGQVHVNMPYLWPICAAVFKWVDVQ